MVRGGSSAKDGAAACVERRSTNFVSDISYNAVAVGEKRA
jgi:hypothetical protein